MKLYAATTLSNEIEWCRFKATCAFFSTISQCPLFFDWEDYELEVSFWEWLAGKPSERKGGKK